MKLTIAAALISAVVLCDSASAQQNSSPVVDCNRGCLYKFVDQYMDALVKHQPNKLPWANHVIFTENNVQLKIGDGLWGTISGKRGYDLKMADPENGQVGFFGVVEEHGIGAVYAMRMKIENKKIAEVETVLSRKVDNSPFPVPDNLVKPRPSLTRDVPTKMRRPRARLISIADGYFDTLQLNDGTLFTEFHDDCNRIENGLRTTNNAEAFPGYDIAALGCADQFRTGQFIYDDRLRERRFPLVDEKKGLVLGGGFIDHSGRQVDVTWTNGKKVTSPFTYPHSYVLLELFKIDDGKIRDIEAVFANVPYSMASPWIR